MRRLYWIAAATLLVLLMAVLVYHLDRAQDALAPRTNEELWLDVGESEEWPQGTLSCPPARVTRWSEPGDEKVID